MNKYQLRIHLLSDLCVSDGGVYNSSLDIDICQDGYGFPYIPARRIKGCLRECALELKDWGRDIAIYEIFGDEGDARGEVSIRNAYIENYAALREQIEKQKDSLLFHPQNVLSHYSYIRTQTTVDNETGVAKDTSLRTMRVAKKGLVFIAEIEMDEKYKTQFDEIISVFRHMGISRTRGLGEVEAKCLPIEDSSKDKVFVDMDAVNRYIEEEGCLRYSIYLEEPVICKSIDGGEARSLDYIQGSQILGMVLQELKNGGESAESFLSEASELFFSNAYLEVEGMRLQEVPATYYSIKNNDKKYVDKAYENGNNKKQNEGRQLNAMKHCYVGETSYGALIKKSVAMEERYHHRRPDDKSIGRAGEGEDGSGIFYQIASIAAGQSFQGYVSGTSEQLQKVAECLSKRQYFSIGASRSSEYGKVKITLHQKKDSKELREDTAASANSDMKLLIKLESPAIVYSRENITYSTDVKDLVEEVDAVLGIQEKPIKIENFLNFTSVGGYNVTWHKRKPTIVAFDKGTVLIYHFKNQPALSVDLKGNKLFRAVIGERNLEGYGEITIRELLPEDEKYIGGLESLSAPENNEEIDVKETEIAWEISKDLWKEYVWIQAALGAKSFCEDKLMKAGATVSNLLNMCEEQEKWAGIRKTVDERYDKNSETKREKQEIALEILGDVEKQTDKLSEKFCEHYNICGWEMDADCSKIEYLKAYLTELKYLIREKKKREGKGGEEA